MKVHHRDDMVTLYHGDCLAVLASMPDNSVDAIVTDPPYGLSNTKPRQVADVLKAWVTGDTEAVPAKRGGFMGKDWDSFVPPPAVWAECLRVLKPGGHMAVFAGTRTQDLMGLSIRLAGFEVRDTLGWIYGSGFPKSHDVGKAIDKLAGAEREIVGSGSAGAGFNPVKGFGSGATTLGDKASSQTWGVTAPATPEAAQWDGWGTALKPAIEPIILARKPTDGTVANNVLEHGVGGLNIEACRIATSEDTRRNAAGGENGLNGESTFKIRERRAEDQAKRTGRWPANVLLDERAAEEMDEQSGVSVSRPTAGGGRKTSRNCMEGGAMFSGASSHADSGGASRFFPVFKYQAKAPKRERPVIEREDGTKIQHPTVKPLALMQWLVRLITPPGGTILDPFAGSGTTIEAALAEGFHPIGIEMEADYLQLITTRIERCRGENSPTPAGEPSGEHRPKTTGGQ